MRLARLDVTQYDLGRLPVLVGDEDRPLVIRLLDADTVTAVAGACADWSGSWGVWLYASDQYSAGLIARDVKTLSHLLELDHVVIDAESDAEEHALVVTALLSDERVSLHTTVLDITDAYNRPAPPRPVTVWNVRDDTLCHGETLLRAGETRGGLTFFVEGPASYSG